MRQLLSRSYSSVKAVGLPEDGLTLTDFLRQAGPPTSASTSTSGLASGSVAPSYFLETYGCQMNVNDTDIVKTILEAHGYVRAASAEETDVLLLNTCAIRENAESKIWQRLGYFKNFIREQPKGGRRGPVVGVLGCMAERLKEKLLEDKMASLVVGPDAYRDLPRLIDVVRPLSGAASVEQAMNVNLSIDETYGDITPVREASDTSVFVSIMRGCNQNCSYCIVPRTRGRERSRAMSSILDEVKYLADVGTKEIWLLGQNVNSYSYFGGSKRPTKADASRDYFAEEYAKGFSSVYKPLRDGSKRFADLLHAVAEVSPEVRIRFTSPHPKDFSDEVIQAIKSHDNICKQIHMPAQHGDSNVLKRMNRGYTREAYDDLVAHIRSSIPGIALSTDMIAGFCGESEEEHKASVDLLRTTQFDNAFLFAYSLRDKTPAARQLVDDVPEAIKKRRLQDLIHEYRNGLQRASAAEIGKRHIVLVEGPSRKNPETQLTGRTDTFKRVVFPNIFVPASLEKSCHPSALVGLHAGDYVAVEIQFAGGGATLVGKPIARTTITEYRHHIH
jgi:MiaB/RimO family radical SAM methylthiotransferase